MRWIFIVIAQCNNSPREDMMLHSDILFWFRSSQFLHCGMCLATNTNVIVFGLTQLGLKPRSFAYKASMLTITPPMWLYTIRNNLCVRNTHVFAHTKMRKLNNINLTFDSQFWLKYFLSICFFSGIRPDKHPIIRLSRSVCITKRPYTNDLTPISQILFNIYLVTFLLQSPSSSEVSPWNYALTMQGNI